MSSYRTVACIKLARQSGRLLRRYVKKTDLKLFRTICVIEARTKHCERVKEVNLTIALRNGGNLL